MSPLEAVQRLAEHDPMRSGRCSFCLTFLLFDGQHKPDCSWLAMPRIVAALEALEFYADRKNYEAGMTWPILCDEGERARRALEGD